MCSAKGSKKREKMCGRFVLLVDLSDIAQWGGYWTPIPI
jgi:hypothetical protein